jgi:hypothetical protein
MQTKPWPAAVLLCCERLWHGKKTGRAHSQFNVNVMSMMLAPPLHIITSGRKFQHAVNRLSLIPIRKRERKGRDLSDIDIDTDFDMR